MAEAAPSYRWNTSHAAEAFDQAAEFIHPFYLTVQDQVLAQLPFKSDAAFLLVDLGAGSGRLVERVLDIFPSAQAVLIDQSEPFLALADRRLQRFGRRAVILKRRLQDDWCTDLPAAPQAIVSMSAVHHLDAAEKRALFARCHDTLADEGVFINGDEYRPESDADYLAQLEWWAAQKNSAEARGLIPASFKPVFEAWYDRNIRRFGEPKQSGDDCHETLAAQIGYLRDAGFHSADVCWNEKLWGVITARVTTVIT
ncbi:MAG: class I SAM-dependent methyltransferase [Pirellulales bacterium]